MIWLTYFANTILQSQHYTIDQTEFIIEKSKFFDRFKDQMNERQYKVIVRIMQAELRGFDGGLSAQNYTSITKTSASTATLDLHDLVEKKILI